MKCILQTHYSVWKPPWKSSFFSEIKRIENEPPKYICISERRREGREKEDIFYPCVLAWKINTAVVQFCSCSLSQFVVFVLFFMIWSHILTVNLKGVQAAFFISLALNHDVTDHDLYRYQELFLFFWHCSPSDRCSNNRLSHETWKQTFSMIFSLFFFFCIESH